MVKKSKKKKNQQLQHQKKNRSEASSKKQHQSKQNPSSATTKNHGTPITSHDSFLKSGTIEFSPKIHLEKSHHSHRTAFQHHYGKYFRKVEKPARIGLKIVLVLFFLIALSIAALFLVFGRDLPDVSQLKTMDFSETTRIYDREGNVLYSIFGEENRKYISLNEISPLATSATIAIEDKNFYHHFGFDIFGIMRAQMKNLQDDSMKQGASTITQQLARNVFLGREKTYDRKIKEILLSMQIEWQFSKDEILEMYLNKIAYGSNSFGIEAASQTFFAKSAKDLDLVESSVLASLPKAPSTFSPYGQNRDLLVGYCKSPDEPQPSVTTQMVDAEENLVDQNGSQIVVNDSETLPSTRQAVDGGTQQTEQTDIAPQPVCASMDDPNYIWGRKDFVLQRMLEDGYITKEQMAQAWMDGLTLKFEDPVHRIEAPHFVFYVKEILEQKYGKDLVESGGLEVRTTLDPRLQSFAEEAIAKQAPINAKRYAANNAGLVSLDPKTGQILAMVGSVDYWDGALNGQVNVTTSYRQPGSSFKPLVYAAAIQNAGIGSGTVLGDYKTIFNKHDIPHDSDNTYKGKMTIRSALNQSRNIPAIKAYYLAGEEEKLLDFLDKVGLGNLRQFKTDFNKDSEKRGWTFNFGWPMAIGSGEVRLLDLASGYGVLANGGKYVPVNPILEVRDRDGNILEQFQAKEGAQAVDPQAAYIVSNMASDVLAKPAGSWRSSMTIEGHTVASKTGTSNKKIGSRIAPNNNIMIGYTPSLVSAVWVGNTDGGAMHGDAWAFSDAGPIWKEFFTAALKDKPDESFPEPEGIKHIGKEVYPDYAKFTDFDKRFKRADAETQQTGTSAQGTTTVPMTVPSSGSDLPDSALVTKPKTAPADFAPVSSQLPPNTIPTGPVIPSIPSGSSAGDIPPYGF